jgi:hypothetical protein
MLTRPGSMSGPAWMRKISDSLANPNHARNIMMPFWAFFLLYMLGILLLVHFITAVALSPQNAYESSTRIAGLPLISYGSSAHGVIAIGIRATGVIALGALAAGFLAIGGITVGVIPIGGVSVGLFALGGVAIGWRALGGVAIGRAALGGVAIGKYAYAGNGVAYGSVEASGRQKEHLIG